MTYCTCEYILASHRQLFTDNDIDVLLMAIGTR
jgi:hypothetical protein